jgi:hypothetical protein
MGNEVSYRVTTNQVLRRENTMALTAEDIQKELQDRNSERASLLQDKEQLEQQLEITNSNIGHVEGGILQLRRLAQMDEEAAGNGNADQAQTALEQESLPDIEEPVQGQEKPKSEEPVQT